MFASDRPDFGHFHQFFGQPSEHASRTVSFSVSSTVSFTVLSADSHHCLEPTVRHPPETVLWTPVWPSGTLLDPPVYSCISGPLKAPQEPVWEPEGLCVRADQEPGPGQNPSIFQIFCRIVCFHARLLGFPTVADCQTKNP